MSAEKPEASALTQQPQQPAPAAGATPSTAAETEKAGGKHDVTVPVGDKQEADDIDAQLAHVGGGLAFRTASSSSLTR